MSEGPTPVPTYWSRARVEAEVARGTRSPGSATRRLLEVFGADRTPGPRPT